MSEKTDYPEEEITGPSDNELKSVISLAREQWRLERKIEKLNSDLKLAKQELMNISERELPNLMVDVDLRGYTLSNGAQLELVETVYASIAKKDLVKAHAWLEEHGHSDLIKREFNIRFDRSDEPWAKKFQRDCNQRKRPLNIAVKRSVHHQTLNAWVRESILAGIVLPEELFGVYKKKSSKLTLPEILTE